VSELPPTLAFAISENFIYKTAYVPTKKWKRSVCQLLRFCQESFKVRSYFNNPAGGAATEPNATGDSLIPSASLPFAFTLTQRLDSAFYEDKGD
jgi:hypothetical protein